MANIMENAGFEDADVEPYTSIVLGKWLTTIGAQRTTEEKSSGNYSLKLEHQEALQFASKDINLIGEKVYVSFDYKFLESSPAYLYMLLVSNGCGYMGAFKTVEYDEESGQNVFKWRFNYSNGVLLSDEDIGNGWKRVRFVFTPSAWSSSSGWELKMNLSSLGTTGIPTVYIDNVYLDTVPEPSVSNMNFIAIIGGLLALGLGLVAYYFLKGRRRK